MNLALAERAVIQLIKTGRATSQGQISRFLSLSPATVHSLLGRLESSHLVCRDRRARNGRGRPIEHYRIKRPDLVLAIHWHDSMWDGGLFHDNQLQGAILSGGLPVNTSLEDTCRSIRRAREQILSQDSLPDYDLAGIALHMNATQNTSDGVLASSVIPWIRTASAKQFSEAVGCEVQLDLRLPRVIPELRARAANGIHSLAVVNVADGVSAHGCVFDSEWGGERFYGGELGHMVIDPKGPLCGCGHRGCVETIISGPAMLRRVDADLKDGIQTRLALARLNPETLFSELYRLHQEGTDSYVNTLVEEFLDRVSWCVAVTRSTVGPDVIVLSGYALQGREAWRQRILKSVQSLVLWGESSEIRLEFPVVTKEDYLRYIADSFSLVPESNGSNGHASTARSRTGRGAHAPSRATIGAPADGSPRGFRPPRAADGAREGACAPRADISPIK